MSQINNVAIQNTMNNTLNKYVFLSYVIMEIKIDKKMYTLNKNVKNGMLMF